MSEKHINKSPLPQHDGRLGVGIMPQGYKQTSIGIIPQDWEVVRLGEVFNISSGATPLRQNKLYWENPTIQWVKIGDLNNSFITTTEEKISRLALEKTTCKLLSKNTLLIAMYGGFNQIGRTGILSIEATTNQAISALITKSDNILPIFANNYLILHKKKWKEFAVSSRKDPNITKADVANFQIPLPPLKEQEKIARILGVWDSALTSLANLIKAKRKYKTALMQRLLTPPKDKKSTHPLAPSAREGEQVRGNSIMEGEVEKAPPLSRGVWGGVSIPNDEEQEKCPRINKWKCVESPRTTKEGESQSSLRFAGFSDKWQEFRLGDLFEITRGYVLPIKKIKKQQDKEYCYPVYSSQTLNGGLMGYYTNYLFEDCITWTTDGANAGEVNFRAGKFYCTNVCGVLISKDGFANKCVAEIINSVSKKYVSYVGNPKLMNNVMSGIKVKIPTLAEQKKIAQVLSACDKEIETLNLKFECLKAQKRGLMQQLLSGKVRVKC